MSADTEKQAHTALGSSTDVNFPPTGEDIVPSSSYDQLGCCMSGLEGCGLFRSDSMALSNDPRFMQDSVIEKRLSAFGGLSACSAFMMAYARSQVQHPGNMTDFKSLEGVFHTLSFILATMALFGNLICMYVTMAQVYHIHRLESSGPTGFEMAAAYYLNPNMCAWRHFAVNCMLVSLPLFLLATGLHCEVAFAAKDFPLSKASAHVLDIEALVIMGAFFLFGMVLWYIHCIHAWIWKEKYDTAMQNATPYLSKVQGMMNAGKMKVIHASQFDAV